MQLFKEFENGDSRAFLPGKILTSFTYVFRFDPSSQEILEWL